MEKGSIRTSVTIDNISKSNAIESGGQLLKVSKTSGNRLYYPGFITKGPVIGTNSISAKNIPS